MIVTMVIYYSFKYVVFWIRDYFCPRFIFVFNAFTYFRLFYFSFYCKILKDIVQGKLKVKN